MKNAELKKAEREGELIQLRGFYPVHCPYPSGSKLMMAWLNGWFKSIRAEHSKSAYDEAVRLARLPKRWKFKAKLLKADERTGMKAGTMFDPKGFYYNGKNVILVGSVSANHAVRLSFPADIVAIEVGC
jgi:hypothetical protein